MSTNSSLLSLNLGNNRLDEGIGRMFVDCLHQNHTLIDFEFERNNFRLEDVIDFQILLFSLKRYITHFHVFPVID